MRTVTFCWSMALSALTVFSLQGCSVAATPATPAAALAPSVAAGTPSTLQRIKAEIGDAPCSTTAQCSSLPIGAKACGGPETYLPWSSGKSSAATLQALAARYNAERRAEIAANHEISTCSMMLAPTAACSPAGHCVLQNAGGGLTPDPT